MNHTERPHNTVDGRTGYKNNRAIKLGSAVRELLDDRISPRQTVFDSVDELWNQLLPVELARHCRIVDISGGMLKVTVDSPPYMHELRLCSPGLVGELQKRCPRARVKSIKFILA